MESQKPENIKYYNGKYVDKCKLILTSNVVGDQIYVEL